MQQIFEKHMMSPAALKYSILWSEDYGMPFVSKWSTKNLHIYLHITITFKLIYKSIPVIYKSKLTIY